MAAESEMSAFSKLRKAATECEWCPGWPSAEAAQPYRNEGKNPKYWDGGSLFPTQGGGFLVLYALQKEGAKMADFSGIRKFKDERDYREHFIVQSEIDKYLPGGKHFIDDALITSTLAAADATPVDPVRIREIIARSEETCETLPVEDVAALMRVEDPGLLEEMRAAADRIKKKVYDNRIVVFAPLYVANPCVNGCRYCGFREGNSLQKRRILTMDEICQEIDVVAGRIGHKRIIAVYGEHPKTSAMRRTERSPADRRMTGA